MPKEQMAGADAPRLFSIVATADRLGVSRGTLFTLLNTGKLAYVRIGRRRLVPAEAIERFISLNSCAEEPLGRD
jgi:excisionase family DNA binding protein